MSAKITREHLDRGALIYVRQSSPGQVVAHTESQRRQYALADLARTMGFAQIEVIDEDLGRSGSGLVDRPGFQRLVGAVCSGKIGAVFCIEASRLARNGRDWHHLIDLCALVGTLVVDSDGVYDPRFVNDRLLLGLKGTMSEYELSLLRQRGLAARDAKAKRGELRFGLPPGYCWNELGRIEMDPDERVAESIRMVFRKFREVGSARQVLLWARQSKIQLPVMRQRAGGARVAWAAPMYTGVLRILQHPAYAGAYVFGRRETRTRVVDGRAVSDAGHRKPMSRWSVLIRDHHSGYITWADFERNMKTLADNAYMQQRAARKSGRGGRALLAGLVRCGRCGRMMRVFYAKRSGHSYRYQCRGDDMRGARLCIGVGGLRVDRAVAASLVLAIEPHAIEAAVRAAEQAGNLDRDVCVSLTRELEQARYEAKLAARRHEAVDPDKRLVARELEARWEAALDRVRSLEDRLATEQARVTTRPGIDGHRLMALAGDLMAVWNAPSCSMRTKQRLVQTVVQEVIVDLNDTSTEVSVVIHWAGGRHTELLVPRVRAGRYPADRRPSAVDAIRKLAGRWPDREIAVALNRMRCSTEDDRTFTTVRVRELRERLGLSEFDPSAARVATVTLDEAARRLSICVASVRRLIEQGILPASQAMPSAPWEIPVAALDSEVVKLGVRGILDRRPCNPVKLLDRLTLRLPGT